MEGVRRSARHRPAGEARLRAQERALARDPSDVGRWLGLSRDYARVGRKREAGEVVLRAARHHPADPALRTRLAELGCAAGSWPAERGPTGCLRAPRSGPDAGVLRWRADLPRRAHGAPRVDLGGRALVRTEPAGLVEVSPDGRRCALLAGFGDWPLTLPPRLLPRDGDDGGGAGATAPDAAGATVCHGAGAALVGAYDPALHDLVAVPAGAASASPLWPAAVVEAGWRFGLGPASVEAVAPGGGFAWSAALPRPVDLACDPRGAVYVVLADLEVLRDSPFDSPGRLVALDPQTGRALGVVGRGRALCGDGQLSVTSAGDAAGGVLAQLGMDLLRCDRAGEVRWSRKLEWAAPPAVCGDAVVVASPVEGLLAYDLLSGERRWRRSELRSGRPPLLDARGVAYAVTTDGAIAAVGPAGELRWQLRPAAVAPLGPPALTPDGLLLVPAGDELLAVR